MFPRLVFYVIRDNVVILAVRPSSFFSPSLVPALSILLFFPYRLSLLLVQSGLLPSFTSSDLPSVQLADIQLKGMIAKFVNFMGLTSTSPTHHLNGTDSSPGIHRNLLYPLDTREGNMDNQADRLVDDVSPFPFSQSSTWSGKRRAQV